MVVFLTGPPSFSTKKKIVSGNHVTKKGPDWLLGNFLFGTEIGQGQLKNHPV